MKKNLGMLALIMAFWFTISFITNILGPLIPDIIHNFNLSDLAMASSRLLSSSPMPLCRFPPD
jgi:fucose permease